jgi:hypothetical protein
MPHDRPVESPSTLSRLREGFRLQRSSLKLQIPARLSLPENEKILTGRRLVMVPKRPSGMNMSVPSRLFFRQLRGSCARKRGKILGFSRGIRALLTWTRPNVRNERALEQSCLRPDAQTQFVPLDNTKLDPPPSMANSAAAPVPRPHHRIVLSSTC